MHQCTERRTTLTSPNPVTLRERHSLAASASTARTSVGCLINLAHHSPRLRCQEEAFQVPPKTVVEAADGREAGQEGAWEAGGAILCWANLRAEPHEVTPKFENRTHPSNRGMLADDFQSRKTTIKREVKDFNLNLVWFHEKFTYQFSVIIPPFPIINNVNEGS